MKSLCLGTILVGLKVVHAALLAQLELLEVSWEWVRNNASLLLGNYHKKLFAPCLRFNFSTEECHLSSLSARCV